VVQRVAGKGDLAAIGRDLDDPAAALFAEVGKCRADEGDGSGQVGRNDVLDLFVRQFFGGSEEAIAGVADNGVDPAYVVEGAVDEVADGSGVGHLQHLGDERIRVTIGEVGDLRGVSDGADHPVSTFEQLTGQFPSEAAADAGNEPVRDVIGRCPFSSGQRV
jgi:hypothetical protein